MGIYKRGASLTVRRIHIDDLLAAHDEVLGPRRVGQLNLVCQDAHGRL